MKSLLLTRLLLSGNARCRFLQPHLSAELVGISLYAHTSVPVISAGHELLPIPALRSVPSLRDPFLLPGTNRPAPRLAPARPFCRSPTAPALPRPSPAACRCPSLCGAAWAPSAAPCSPTAAAPARTAAASAQVRAAASQRQTWRRGRWGGGSRALPPSKMAAETGTGRP